MDEEELRGGPGSPGGGGGGSSGEGSEDAFGDIRALADFRALKPKELNFVLDSWSHSYQRSPWAGVVPNHRYQGLMREMIAGLLGRGMKVLVAAEPESGRVMGYVAFEPKGADLVLHYCYVKDPFRRLGLGRVLIKEAMCFMGSAGGRVFITHRTKAGRSLEGNAIFAPEIARRKDL